MKAVSTLLGMIIFISCAGNQIIKLNFTEKFEGQTQLVLASQTSNVDFTEDVSKRLLGIFASHAKVKVNSNVTYDFYVDFDKDGYEAKLDKKTKTLYFTAPIIKVKKPVINASNVSYPETGLLVNEPQEAVRILESLTDKFIDEGKQLLEEERVQTECKQKLTNYLAGLTKELGYDIEHINVSFKTGEEKKS